MARKTKYELKKPRNDPSMKVKETNLPAKKYKHSNPTQLKLSFELDGSTQSYAYIDLAQSLTIANRKMFRQHAYYYVQSVSLYDDATNYVDVVTAPDTYVTRNAVVRGKAIWDDMNERVAGKTGGFIPKFHDYKVKLDGGQALIGNLLPHGYGLESSAGGPQLPSGEWNYSHYVSADSDRDGNADPDIFTAHICGDDQTTTTPKSMGLIKSYGLTRRAPYDENPVVPSGIETDDFLNVIDYSDEEQVNSIIDHLDRHNDDTPYSETEYIGTDSVTVLGHEFARQMCHQGRMSTVAGINRVSTIGGFCAPFGLIGLDLNNLDGAARLVITLAPGTYHGVLAERV